MSLPLEHDRMILKKAAHLMQAYAGKAIVPIYSPCFQLGKEIKYQIIRREIRIMTIPVFG